MEAARTARNFKKSDAIRAELTDAGIIIENTKKEFAGAGSEPARPEVRSGKDVKLKVTADS